MEPARPSIRIGDTVSLALETNGKGYLGFLVELPGCFVRGRTEEEALSKVSIEARSYLNWLGNQDPVPSYIKIVQRHKCSLMVEDADCEILLDADKGPLDPDEFEQLVNLVQYSGRSFMRLCDDAAFKDWVDPARLRNTFYGKNPRTIREIFSHVKRTQYYYLSRATLSFVERDEDDFTWVRRFCLARIRDLYDKDGNSKMFEKDQEQWTLKKILRRFIWHDRIHGRAIARILEKQKQLSLIDDYNNPFRFETTQFSLERVRG